MLTFPSNFSSREGGGRVRERAIQRPKSTLGEKVVWKKALFLLNDC